MIAPVRQTEDFYLSKDARTSPVWAEVLSHVERMLENKRAELEHPKLTEQGTNVVRGHIQCLKALVALGHEPPPKVEPSSRPRSPVDLGAKYG